MAEREENPPASGADGCTPAPFPTWRIEPLRIRVERPEDGGRALRGVGFRFRCQCGADGARRATYQLARLDATAHSAEAHTVDA